MRLEFELRDRAGSVSVTLGPNEEPEALGCDESGRGFPVCTAAIDYDGRGYLAALGWIQVVRSTDNKSGGAEFELDPYEPLGATPHPFCWFGFTPALFDAPSRRTRAHMDWTAHSFLSFIGAPREARAILGFSWGFLVRDREISIVPSARLTPAEWNAHLPLLRRQHPSWRFAPGYNDC